MDIKKNLDYERKLKACKDKEYYTLGEFAQKWSEESHADKSDTLELLCLIISKDSKNKSVTDILSGKDITFADSVKLIHPDNSHLINIEQHEDPENTQIHRDHLRVILERQGMDVPNFLSEPTPKDDTKQQTTIRAENQCQKWLEDLMSNNSNQDKGKKLYQDEARQAHKVGTKAFIRAWSNAITATGNTNWGRPGRKKSKP